MLTILIIASGLNVASPKLFADVSQAADKPRPRAPTTSSWAVRQASIQRSRAEPLIGAEGRAERPEGYLWVGEHGDVYRLGGADEGLELVVDVPDVDVHAREHPVAGEPEGDELTSRHVTAEDDLVVATGLDVSGVFHAQVVLIGEEVRNPVVYRILSAEHRLGRDLRLVQRVGPVLDADVLAQQRVEGMGHVTGGIDVRIGGAQPFVDADAVVDLQARLLRQPDVRLMPTPTMTTSASMRVPSDSRTPSTAPPLPVISATCAPNRRSTPWSRCRFAKS
ncbi:hypothetical protein SAFG77S_09962 [Streptomyces afghaniensis]